MARVIGTIDSAARGTMQVRSANLTSGFPASAVDIGKLQAALERGLTRFDQAQLEARWSEIFQWIASVIGAWVQRRKELKIERRETGIRIELMTQDDLGYYRYGFDVFPRRRSAAPKK